MRTARIPFQQPLVPPNAIVVGSAERSRTGVWPQVSVTFAKASILEYFVARRQNAKGEEYFDGNISRYGNESAFYRRLRSRRATERRHLQAGASAGCRAKPARHCSTARLSDRTRGGRPSPSRRASRSNPASTRTGLRLGAWLLVMARQHLGMGYRFMANPARPARDLGPRRMDSPWSWLSMETGILEEMKRVSSLQVLRLKLNSTRR